MTLPVIERTIFDAEHDAFREAAGTFLDREVVPHHEQWEVDGVASREAWAKAGEAGFLAFQFPEEYGGGGTADFRFNAVLNEEMAKRGVYGAMYPLFNDMIVPYLVHAANDEQKARWFPDLAAGRTIGAIAMTEPGAGSDLQGIRTTAVDKGDHYLVNGQKTFISNGILADVVITVVRTNPEAGHQGISLLVLERGMAGFERGRNLDKLGMKAQDTAELSFTDVVVPKENLLGAEGSGFVQLMTNLSQERLSIAIGAAEACQAIAQMSLEYVTSRTAFGKPIGSFQHNRFVLAEMATEARVVRTFVDDCLRLHVAGKLDPATASMAKWWSTELQKKMVDQGVQLHGGYGYMWEYPITRAYANSRVQTIYGGTTEVQKEIIGRTLGL